MKRQNGKIICRKLECPSCKCLALAQIFLRKNETVRYIRFRHYEKLDAATKKPLFTYHAVENLADYLETLKTQGIC